MLDLPRLVYNIPTYIIYKTTETYNQWNAVVLKSGCYILELEIVHDLVCGIQASNFKEIDGARYWVN